MPWVVLDIPLRGWSGISIQKKKLVTCIFSVQATCADCRWVAWSACTLQGTYTRERTLYGLQHRAFVVAGGYEHRVSPFILAIIKKKCKCRPLHQFPTRARPVARRARHRPFTDTAGLDRPPALLLPRAPPAPRPHRNLSTGFLNRAPEIFSLWTFPFKDPDTHGGTMFLDSLTRAYIPRCTVACFY